MYTIIIIAGIIAISLSYFKHEFSLFSNFTIISLFCSLPLLWESRGIHFIDLFNGAIIYTTTGNILVWLLVLVGICLIHLISVETLGSFSQSYDHTYNERVIFTISAIIGGIILNSASESLTILLGLELQSYSVYILAASYRNYEPSEAAGLKYFLLGALSSALIFMGLGIIYSYNGSTNINYLLIMKDSIYDILPYAGITLILSGLLFKIAAAPVHAWSIDVYDAVPIRTTAILTLIPKIALFSITTKIITLISNNNTGIAIILFIIILSFIFGSIPGLFQPRIKRLLAYSSTLNVGFILMGALLSNATLDYYNPTLYIIQYILVTAAIWVSLIYLSNNEITLISQLQGLHTSSKSTVVLCLTILILSTAGIPPMVGFYAKYSIINAALNTGYISLALIAVLASIISTVYYLSIIKMMWSKSNIESRWGLSDIITLNKDNNINTSLIISVLTLMATLFLLQYSVVFTYINL